MEVEEADAPTHLWGDDLEEYLEALDGSFAHLPEQGRAAQLVQRARQQRVTNPAAMIRMWPLD